MPTNNYGPWYPTASGGGSGAVSNPSLQIPPQSPSGSVTGESAAFNYANDITSTEEFLTNVIEVDSAQQGTPALNATNQVVLAGVAAIGLAINNWYAGADGTPGNKFS